MPDAGTPDRDRLVRLGDVLDLMRPGDACPGCRRLPDGEHCSTCRLTVTDMRALESLSADAVADRVAKIGGLRVIEAAIALVNSFGWYSTRYSEKTEVTCRVCHERTSDVPLPKTFPHAESCLLAAYRAAVAARDNATSGPLASEASDG